MQLPLRNPDDFEEALGADKQLHSLYEALKRATKTTQTGLNP